MNTSTETNLQRGCPSRDTLACYSLGTLNSAQIDSVAAHVEQCPRCMEALGQLEDCSDALIDDLAGQRWDLFGDEDDGEESSLTECLMAPSGGNWPALAVPVSPSSLAQPRQIGPYEILEPLGEGAMGAVYKARHAHLGKIVALKLLPPDKLSDASAVALFVQEMKAVGQLSHPNIVQAHDAGVEGTPYLAMELLDGMDLYRVVKKTGPMRTADACWCVQQTARGLHHAHLSGMVHRDVKPSNLLLTRQGDVKLLDLGLARLESAKNWESPEGESAGRAAVMGTLDYIAPEQLRNSATVDIRADLYSLGCTMFFLLTGRPPFAGKDRTAMGKLQAHLHEMPPDIRAERPDIPLGLGVILERLLAKESAFRFTTPEDLALSLEPYVEGANLRALFAPDSPPVITPAPDVIPSPDKPSVLMRLRIWAVCLLVFGGVVATCAAFLANGSGRDNDPDPGFTDDDRQGAARITTFEVDYCRRDETGPVWAGTVSNRAGTCTVRDGFRVRGKLSGGSHSYLIVIQPGGQELVCALENEVGPTQARDTLLYPPVGDLRADEPGLYTFVLLAGAHPLPEYERWRASARPWTETPPAGQGAWKFDGKTAFQTSGLDAPGMTGYLKQLCEALALRPGVDTVQAIAFTVIADKPPEQDRSVPD